jgi:hypothetical protein
MSEGQQRKAETYDDAWNMQTRFAVPCCWIQWKGTSVCMDFTCVCGAAGHVDAEFAYNVKCASCGRVFFVNGHIELIEIENPDSGMATVEAE